MDVPQPRVRTSFVEYRGLPESNQIVELIGGAVVVNPPLDKHQICLGEIYLTLRTLRLGGKLRIAPTGLYINQENSFEPDLFWVGPQNACCFLRPDGRYWQGAPDLVVEIVSPSTAANDRGHKFNCYERAGVREYWLVDSYGLYVETYHLRDGRLQRAGVHKADESFESPVLGATIATGGWFLE